MPFLILFLVWPLLEIVAFMQVADETGILNTVLLAIGLVIAGMMLVQVQGLKTLATMQAALAEGRLPAQDLFNQVCLFVAGVLLILPGFLSDVLAVVLLIAPLRHAIRNLLERFFVGEPVNVRGFGPAPPREEVIEGEFVLIESEDTSDKEDNRPLLP